jgi:hypothetical protein
MTTDNPETKRQPPRKNAGGKFMSKAEIAAADAVVNDPEEAPHPQAHLIVHAPNQINVEGDVGTLATLFDALASLGVDGDAYHNDKGPLDQAQTLEDLGLTGTETLRLS